jgi:hypothetical protein
MMELNWWGERLTVSRIVLPRTMSNGLAQSFRQQAIRHGLEVAWDDAAPRAADLWLECQPADGWAHQDGPPAGWIRGIELPLLLAQLRHQKPAARPRERTDPPGAALTREPRLAAARV